MVYRKYRLPIEDATLSKIITILDQSILDNAYILYFKLNKILNMKFTKKTSVLLIIYISSKMMIEDIDITCVDILDLINITGTKNREDYLGLLIIYEVIMCRLCGYRFFISHEDYISYLNDKSKYVKLLKSDAGLNNWRLWAPDIKCFTSFSFY